MTDTGFETSEAVTFDRRVKRFRTVYFWTAFSWAAMVVVYLLVPEDTLAGALSRLAVLLPTLAFWGLIVVRFTPEYVLGDQDDEWSSGLKARADRVALRVLLGLVIGALTIVTFWNIGTILLRIETRAFSIQLVGMAETSIPLLTAWIFITFLPGLCLAALLRPIGDD